jgi:predicted transposase/invertase (TIGR01784 family)
VRAKYINPYTDFDQKQLSEYEESLKHYRDLKGAMNTSFEDGEKKGGENKAKEIAAKLKETGIDIDIIAKTTGLSKEEIEKL